MSAPLGYELRFWPEFGRLLTDTLFWAPARPPASPPEQSDRRQPVLLIPGFMAGDASLTVLAGWLAPPRPRGARQRACGSTWTAPAECSGAWSGVGLERSTSPRS